MSILRGRVVLVTGASAGLGAATARAFAARGAKLVLAARGAEALDELVREIANAGGEALAVSCDVADEAAVAAMFAQAVDRFGSVDILINNAGVGETCPVEELALADWRRIIDTNLTGAFLCAKHAFPIMRAAGRGRIVNIGSVAALTPREHHIAYAASKAGLAGLTHALAIDGRSDNIAVSILHPGVVQSQMSEWAGDLAMPADVIAQSVVQMCDLPDSVNLYDATILPNAMPFLGRG